MPHTYATVAQGNDEIKSDGSTTFSGDSASVVAKKLGVLEAVSRRIEDVAQRSSFGSGFGPRIGINYYDGDGTNQLLLKDDCLTLPTLSIAATTGATPLTATLSTDYYLANPDGYTGPPWRKVILHQRGNPLYFGQNALYPGAMRTTSTPSTSWGYEDRSVVSSATLNGNITASATSVVVSDGTQFSPGNTILVGTEQLYVTAISTNTLTVVRGANGTTAATALTAAAISVYQYDSRVVLVARRLFLKRWGPNIGQQTSDQPGVIGLEGEDTIIRRGLGNLVLLGQY